MKSKKEEANQDQETPKLDVTKESTEDKIDASELSECNGRELGAWNTATVKWNLSESNKICNWIGQSDVGYQCGFCEKKFQKSTKLRNHISRVHKGDIGSLKPCYSKVKSIGIKQNL